MNCEKKIDRNIFNLFKEYSCDRCLHYKNKEFIYIGRNKIYIYYLNECDLNNDLIDNSKVRLIFKDIILNNNDKNIFIWLDSKDDFHKYYDDFENMMENGYEIRIIC